MHFFQYFRVDCQSGLDLLKLWKIGLKIRVSIQSCKWIGNPTFNPQFGLQSGFSQSGLAILHNLVGTSQQLQKVWQKILNAVALAPCHLKKVTCVCVVFYSHVAKNRYNLSITDFVWRKKLHVAKICGGKKSHVAKMCSEKHHSNQLHFLLMVCFAIYLT